MGLEISGVLLAKLPGDIMTSLPVVIIFVWHTRWSWSAYVTLNQGLLLADFTCAT